MRILYCWSYYEPYLKSFYAANPGFSDMTYRDQNRLIKLDYFGVPGSYAIWTERLGHDCELVITNCEPMQRRWAEENGVDFKDGWQQAIAIEQVKQFQPDVFFMGSVFALYGDFLDEIKKYSRKTVGWIACPIPNGVKLNQMDALLSSVPQFVDNFSAMGILSEYMPPAFDPDILEYIDTTSDLIPFSFVGGVTRDHKVRYNLLTQLVVKSPLEVWGYGVKSHGMKEMILNLFSGRHFIDPIVHRYRGEAWGLGMYKLLKRSKITFNSHIDVAGDCCGNTRMYEATGVGTLLLTDNKRNISELFEPGKEVVVYDSVNDAVEKVDYYLTHEEERKQISLAGQKRTLTDHSFKNNVLKLIDIYSNLISRGTHS